MAKIVMAAKIENLRPMLNFISDMSRQLGFSKENINEIEIACEEPLVNVINYAYPDKKGDIEVSCNIIEDNGLEIQIGDSGQPFDPIAKVDPDIHAPLQERKIGGLGIYMMKNIMDKSEYKRDGDKNVLTLIKYIGEKDKSKGGSAAGEESFSWPLEYMKRETFKKGDILFKKGDAAEKMYYIKSGALRLTELNLVVGSGQVIGEMGIFSPYKERTASAVCEEDLEAYSMGKDEVIRFFRQDPAMAISLTQLSIKRFIENLKKETEARERLASELRIAHDIQNSMLPRIFPPFPDRKEFEIYAMMDAAKEVGGDFYDFFFVDKDKLCVIIGDVSGKGVPAALFMAISKTLFKTEAMRGLLPNETIENVNNLLCVDNQMCMFVTIFCLVLDTRTGQVVYSNGGHNPPLVCSYKACFDFVKGPSGLVVGAMEGAKAECGNIKLEPNDFIFLYTDGVTEAMNSKRELFTEERLQSALCKLRDQEITQVVQNMRQELFNYVQDAPQSDDITMVVLKYKGDGDVAKG